MRVLRPIRSFATSCDFCHRTIPGGKPSVLVKGDGEVLAQGNYHSLDCYNKALEDYKAKQKGGISPRSDENDIDEELEDTYE